MEGISWSLTCKAYSLLLLSADPLKSSRKPKSIRRRTVREGPTYPLAFLSCLCLHSSPGGHQLEKKPGQNWIHPLPSTSLDSEHKSWVLGAPRPSSWWVKADCKCTSLPLQRVWCVVSGGTPRLQGGIRSIPRERNLKSLILAPRDVLACLHQTLLQFRGTTALPVLNSQTK